MTNQPTVVFMGTPEFALTILESLVRSKLQVIAVYTQPSKPAGRGQKLTPPPCALYAQENGLPLYQPDKLDEEAINTLKHLGPDYIVVAAYGLFIPKAIRELPNRDILNVHASLLPEYRGASPISQALLDHKKETGVSIMRVVKEMDAGPVFSQQSIPITVEDTTLSLTQKLAQTGAQLLIQTIDELQENAKTPREQDAHKATHAGKIKKTDGIINWNQPAKDIRAQVQAYIPWPVASTHINGKKLKIYSAKIIEKTNPSLPGTVEYITPQGVEVACQTDSLLLEEVQLEGKKRMNASDFARGFRLEVGSKFS